MEDFINRIIDIDKEARRMSVDYDKLKAQADIEIDEKCRKINQQFTEKTEQRISQYKIEQQAASDKRLAEKKVQYADIIKQFDGVLEKHRKQWVEELVTKALE